MNSDMAMILCLINNNLNNTALIAYTCGLDASGSMQGAGGVHFPAYDLNGNVMGLVNATNGNISAKYEYGPFGEVFCSVGDMVKVNPFGFSTKYTDSETDFVYYGYRYYSPALGRWMSRDPIEERGGLNLYAFVNNDPVNLYDPHGLCCIPDNFDGTAYFIWRFYGGAWWNWYVNGNNYVDIGDLGYIENYRQALDVRKFECEARNSARKSVNDCCAPDGTKWYGKYNVESVGDKDSNENVRVVNATDGLFVMGKGIPGAHYKCEMKNKRVICKITYKIRDSFEDPLNIDEKINKYIENKIGFKIIPNYVVNLLGCEYGLVGNWDDEFDGCSEKEDCSVFENTSRR